MALLFAANLVTTEVCGRAYPCRKLDAIETMVPPNLRPDGTR